MPRENSFSDEDGRSLTPDLEDNFRLQSPVSQKQSREYLPKSPIPPQHLTSLAAPTAPQVSFNGQTLTPKERFRSSVRKVMRMRKASAFMFKQGVGAEPGIDVRSETTSLAYGHIRQQCVIELSDYSTVRSSFGRMTNREFINYLEDPRASEREPWVKVRWINIGGISWDVIRALALKYDLHPLALEDLLHHSNRLRSKADYYPQHLFLRVLSHTLAKDSGAGDSYMDHLPRSESPEPMDEKTDYSDISFDKGHPPTTTRSKSGGIRKVYRRETVPPVGVDIESVGASRDPTAARFGSFAPSVGLKQDANTLKLIEELKEGDKVNVALNPVFIFLFRDGTVISMHPKPNLGFTAPIRERLHLRSTVLRSTADPSLLVHSLLDLIVDLVMEVVDEYQSKIVKLEHDILLRPKMKAVRFLHILSGDLTLHKRTLEPIRRIIYGLRRYDRDRVAAMYDTKDLPEGWKPEGYMSHKATIYLADVHDHMEYILASLDMFAGISENLINYTFNTASYNMNEVMRKLTLVTIICLPLTLFTGYFGMNFESMWSVKEHSDVFFWQIALPVMAIVIPLFTWPDLVKVYHYGKKKVGGKRPDRRLNKT